MFFKSGGRAIWPTPGGSILPGLVYGIGTGWGWPSISQTARVAADVIIVNTALALAFMSRLLWAMVYEQDRLGDLTGQGLAEHYLLMYWSTSWIVTGIVIGMFWLNGFYTYARTYPIRRKATLVAEAVTFAFVVVGMAAFVARDAMQLPRSVLILAWAMALALFLASRVWSAIWRRIVQYEGKQRTRRKRTATPPAPARGSMRRAANAQCSSSGEPATSVRPFCRNSWLKATGCGCWTCSCTAPVRSHRSSAIPNLEMIRADFRRVDALVAAMQGVDHLVHLGGIVGDPACAIDEELTIDVNLAATRLIGEVAKGNGIKHFVFASTCSVYGASEEALTESSALNPLSLYARSKVASERLLLEMADDRFTPIIVRFGTIYGLSGRTRFDLVVNLLAAKAVFDGCITVFGGDQWRPFLHVDDAALAVAQLLGLPPGRGAEIYNVGSNAENYTIARVGEIVKKIVPEAELVMQAADQDRRNYKVNFSKIQADGWI